MVTVRRVGPAQVDEWVRLRLALMASEDLLAPGDDGLALTAAVSDWLRERLDSAAFGAYVAEVDGRVVGSGGITVYDSPPGPGLGTREAYIMSMYTEPEWRGRGVARAVLAALILFARSAGGVGRVWLRASAMGRSLYERAGFEGRDSYMQIVL